VKRISTDDIRESIKQGKRSNKLRAFSHPRTEANKTRIQVNKKNRPNTSLKALLSSGSENLRRERNPRTTDGGQSILRPDLPDMLPRGFGGGDYPIGAAGAD
jgi:hypothetical protein